MPKTRKYFLTAGRAVLIGRKLVKTQVGLDEAVEGLSEDQLRHLESAGTIESAGAREAREQAAHAEDADTPAEKTPSKASSKSGSKSASKKKDPAGAPGSQADGTSPTV